MEDSGSEFKRKIEKLGSDIEAFRKKLEEAKKKFKMTGQDKEKEPEKDKEKETEKDREKETEKDKKNETADTVILSGDTIYDNLLDVGSTYDLHDYYGYQTNAEDSWSDPGSPLHMSTPRKTC